MQSGSPSECELVALETAANKTQTRIPLTKQCYTLGHHWVIFKGAPAPYLFRSDFRRGPAPRSR